ncbi:MAG TPA: tetratricopeptide repeat protein [Hymenobacter sp.]|jgi:tetratricopeptide (TPR) repeat protein
MTATTDIELKQLLQELERDPTNLDVMNSLAIGYFENYNQKTDKEDYDYFEKAYNLKKTVKSTHNFAWFLYFEWSEIEWHWKQKNAIELAFQIQKECIDLNPKSYYPYYQFGYMLLDQKKFKEAIPFLDKAYNIEKHRDIIHNIGYFYFKMNEFQKAKELFSQSITDLDIENRSLYNLALTEWKLNNTQQVKLIADKLSKYIETNIHETISGYEIELLYFLLNDLQQASESLIKQGVNGIDLLDWTDLSYSLYKTNNKLWIERINASIDERKKWSKEITSNHKDWIGNTEEEKKERLTELEKEIKVRQEILTKEMTKPIQDLNKNLTVEHCGCLLFDCKRHENKTND